MATKSIAWNDGSGDHIRLTYTGSGNGTVIVESDVNNGAARSQVVAIETLDETKSKNLTINQNACPVPIGTILNYSYTGSVQSVTLPPGTYKLQCWGAQGGSNAAASSYGITAQAGGKGGYSEGVLTLITSKTLYIFVGGQGGSSGNGGWNGGGGGNGTCSATSGDTFGYTKVGCGGGATDIALVTSSMSYSSYRNNRSSASLLSRIIVAGGGSGGACGYKRVTTSQTITNDIWPSSSSSWEAGTLSSIDGSPISSTTRCRTKDYIDVNNVEWFNIVISSYNNNEFNAIELYEYNSSKTFIGESGWKATGSYTPTSGTRYVKIVVRPTNSSTRPTPAEACNAASLSMSYTTSSTTTETNSQVGYVGGGNNGGGISGYAGKQNEAGYGGAFGFGANQHSTSDMWHGGLGGAGWYGGGRNYSVADIANVNRSGGGSGFVNIAASAGNRPSGYTGIELDSGETRDGATSFPNTAGTGNETGHSGNGYAKITRLS